jgi:hypothetical protein
MELLTSESGREAITIGIIIIMPYVLFILTACNVSAIKKELKEINKSLTALLNEQRRIAEQQPTYYRNSEQAAEMDSVEPPRT